MVLKTWKRWVFFRNDAKEASHSYSREGQQKKKVSVTRGGRKTFGWLSVLVLEAQRSSAGVLHDRRAERERMVNLVV